MSAILRMQCVSISFLTTLLCCPFLCTSWAGASSSDLMVSREGSSLKIDFSLDSSAYWSLKDPRGVVCSRGDLVPGSNSVKVPKVASTENLFFEVVARDGRHIINKSILGTRKPSKLAKKSGGVRIYQLVPRTYLAGGTGKSNQGKLESLTEARLIEIRELGIDYLWVTGVLEYATPDNTDRDVVKGEAGSYFAVHDSWDIHEGLGGLPAFESFLDRAHRVGLRVLIDLVPNHTARTHMTDVVGKCGVDFGFNDREDEKFSPMNTYYYLDAEALIPPRQLSVEGTDGIYDRDFLDPGIQMEQPAKATGNDIFSSRPSIDDWFETAKLNYGWNYAEGRGYFDPTPTTWVRTLDVATYWLNKGVDGFRVDFAHSVPMEFWRFFSQNVRQEFPHAFLLAEAYETDSRMKLPGFSYEELLKSGFDSVYNSEAYWKMRAVAQGDVFIKDTGLPKASRAFSAEMLSRGFSLTYYMENHDEIRIASRFFSKFGGTVESIRLGWAMTAYLGLLPGNLLIHGGQELSEDASIYGAFAGDIGKTSIFDFVYQSQVRDWIFGNQSALQHEVRKMYTDLLTLKGKRPFDLPHSDQVPTFLDVMDLNNSKEGSQWISAYLRHIGNDRFLVVTNTDPSNDHEFTLHFTDQSGYDSHGILSKLKLTRDEKIYRFRDVLHEKGWEPFDSAIGHHGVPGWVLFRSEGIPSGLYLGKIPRASTRVLKISSDQ